MAGCGICRSIKAFEPDNGRKREKRFVILLFLLDMQMKMAEWLFFKQMPQWEIFVLKNWALNV